MTLILELMKRSIVGGIERAYLKFLGTGTGLSILGMGQLIEAQAEMTGEESRCACFPTGNQP